MKIGEKGWVWGDALGGSNPSFQGRLAKRRRPSEKNISDGRTQATDIATYRQSQHSGQFS